jgi:hypothetical protein
LPRLLSWQTRSTEGGKLMKSLLRTKLVIWIAAGLVAGPALVASARPEFSRREGVACDYCHVNGSPGALDQLTGRRQGAERNARGAYYGSHNHTFQGYVEATTRPKAVYPNFRYAWKEEFTSLPRRIAVGDVTGDGKPRLVTLEEKPDDKNASKLEVLRWDGKAFVSEFAADAAAAPDRLAVGKFGGSDRPAVILTSDALWSWNGTTFVRHPAPTPMAIFGSARMQDGSERVLLAPTSKTVLAYRVNLTPVRNDDWLIDPVAAPSPPKNLWGDMHSTPEFLSNMGVPDELGAGGMLGIWYVRKFITYFIYQIDRDSDVGPDPQHPGRPKITYNNVYYVTVRDVSTGKKLWTSPRLPGEGYDIVLDDPKGGGKPGLLVLFNGTTPSAGGARRTKGRTIAFFTMD